MFTSNKTLTSPSVGLGSYRLEFELYKMSDFSKEIVCKELRETPENIANGLVELKRLLKEESDLCVPLDNDEWLMGILRLCKLYPQSAKAHIKNYYNFQRRYISNLKNVTPKQLKHVFEDNHVFILPKRDQLGRRIVFIRSGAHWDQKKISEDDHFMASYITQTVCGLEPNTQINGIITIIDCDGLNTEQASKYSTTCVKRLIESYTCGSSLPTKALHFINEPQMMHKIFDGIKPMMSKNLRECVHFHGSNMTSLREYISPACLPVSCGGTMKLELDYGSEMSKFMESFE